MSTELKKAIVLTHAYYHRGQALQDAVLAMYIEDLNDLDPAACINAYNRWRRNPANRNFPLPAQIRELVNPEEFVAIEAKARETAARICAAIPKFGWNNWKEARAFIGPDGWEVVQRQGGWSHLCENFGESVNPTAFQAQVRDQLEAVFRYGRQTLEHTISALSEGEVRRGSLERAGFGIRALIPTGDDDPDGVA